VFCQRCGIVELEQTNTNSEWDTDENGAPIKIEVCANCASQPYKEKREQQIDDRLSGFIIVTTDALPTMKITKVLGLARGGTVRARHFGRDIGAGLKGIVGGEIKGYTALLAEAREEALYRMKLDAESLGANGVIGFRFSTASISLESAEVTAYGTAVIADKEEITK